MVVEGFRRNERFKGGLLVGQRWQLMCHAEFLLSLRVNNRALSAGIRDAIPTELLGNKSTIHILARKV
jgi:hypothetical protein